MEFTLFSLLFPVTKITPDIAMMIRPDEKAVMTYLSCFYHAFQGLHQVKHLCHFQPNAFTNKVSWHVFYL